MDQNFRKQLRKFSKQAVKVAKKVFDMNEVAFDHVAYQTVSKDDYLKVIKTLKGVEIIGEIPHAGRVLTLVRIIEPLNVDGIQVDRIEIAEPKPKRTVKKRRFDHFSFYVTTDFDEVVNRVRSQGIKISEVKQIGDHLFIKCCENEYNLKIELRNRPLEEAFTKGEVAVKKEEYVENDSDSDEISQLKKALENEKEKTLRALADYQNLQRRVEKEKRERSLISEGMLLGKILEIIDDFERVIEGMKIDEKDQVGIRMIYDKLKQLLSEHGLEEVSCKIGDPMDPHMCEAIGVVATNEGEKENSVKQIVQKGYKSKENGQVIRPAKVIVAKKS